MDNDKLFELMTKMYGEMQEGFKDVRSEISDVKVDLKDVRSEISDLKGELKNFREEANKRFDKLENQLDDMEADNANRHISMGGDIKRIKAGLSKIEIITADNWGDIARLKSTRKYKTK